MAESDKETETKAKTQAMEIELPGPLSEEDRDRLGSYLFGAIKDGDAESVRDYVRQGANVNVCAPANGGTPLHHCAAYSARLCLAPLLRCGRCDYLIRDDQGRYASEVAYEVANDPRIGGILARKEAKQAAKTGIEAWPKS